MDEQKKETSKIKNNSIVEENKKEVKNNENTEISENKISQTKELLKEKVSEEKNFSENSEEKEIIEKEKTNNKEDVKKEPDKKISFDSSILKFVYMTEKSIKSIEKENKLIFIVNRKSTKHDIKKSVEMSYGEKVLEVKTMIDQKARKKAFVKFEKSEVAGDIAIKLGII